MKPQMNTGKHRRCSGASAKRRSVSDLCESVVKHAGVRWVAAPQSSLSNAPAVQGVALAPNEDVQWFWTHTPSGSYVSGYSIVPSVELPPEPPRKAIGRHVPERRPTDCVTENNSG
jgi:uncharacterized circularly permuted ATP-grasp superfamily protein